MYINCTIYFFLWKVKQVVLHLWTNRHKRLASHALREAHICSNNGWKLVNFCKFHFYMFVQCIFFYLTFVNKYTQTSCQCQPCIERASYMQQQWLETCTSFHFKSSFTTNTHKQLVSASFASREAHICSNNGLKTCQTSGDTLTWERLICNNGWKTSGDTITCTSLHLYLGSN